MVQYLRWIDNDSTSSLSAPNWENKHSKYFIYKCPIVGASIAIHLPPRTKVPKVSYITYNEIMEPTGLWSYISMIYWLIPCNSWCFWASFIYGSACLFTTIKLRYYDLLEKNARKQRSSTPYSYAHVNSLPRTICYMADSIRFHFARLIWCQSFFNHWWWTTEHPSSLPGADIIFC
jgi:hypothetical protein